MTTASIKADCAVDTGCETSQTTEERVLNVKIQMLQFNFRFLYNSFDADSNFAITKKKKKKVSSSPG